MNHPNSNNSIKVENLQAAPAVSGSALQAYALPLVLIVFVAVLACLRASTVLMWYDEMATYEPARLAAGADTLRFYETGLDTPSPTGALVLHYWMSIAGDNDVTNRIPFIFFYLVMCWFIYAFVARRYAKGYAAAAVLFLAASGAFQYSTEMRTYSIILCCMSIAMWSWQSLEEKRSHIPFLCAMWAALAGAMLGHVFSVFLFVPFAVAELYRWRSSGVLRKSVWAVLFTAPLSIVVLLPGIVAANHTYGKLFWSKPNFANLLDSYVLSVRKPGLAAIAVALLAVFLFAKFRSRQPKEPVASNGGKGFTGPEWALILTLCVLPLYAFVCSFAIGVFVPRYVLSVILGVALALVGIAGRLLRNSSRAGLAIAAVFTLLAIGAQYKVFSHLAKGEFGARLVARVQHQPWELAACEANLPVLASNVHDFFEYQHYAPPCLREKLYYGEDLQKAALSPRAVGDEDNMRLFPKLIPLHVVPFDRFVSEHPEFLVFDTTLDGESKPQWFLTFLNTGQKEIQVVSKVAYPRSYYAPTDLTTGTVTLYRIKSLVTGTSQLSRSSRILSQDR
jgi:hypothetical protein